MRRPTFSLADTSVILLIAVLLLSIYALNSQIKKNREMVITRAQSNAAVLAEFATAAHMEYSDTIERLAWSNPDTANGGARYSDRLAPFPEQFSRKMAQRFSAGFPGMTFKLYSEHPVNPRKYRRLDQFAQDALVALHDTPGGTFVRNELKENGRIHVRYASAIVMRRSCVDCHNAPEWGTTRNDWAVGDVRGVREVSIMLPKSAFLESPGLRELLFLMFLSCGLGVFVIYPAVRREVTRRAYFNGLSDKMNARAKTYRRQAYTDPLSGLPNRRSFERALDTLSETASANSGGLGLILVDIDHFKAVNDTHGHDIGDMVIRDIGSALRGAVRPNDIVARVGGEEFGIVLSGGDMAVFLDIAERVRRVVAARSFKAGSERFTVTVSAGVAQFVPGLTEEALYKAADTQLYRAKEAGRNTVCH